MVGRIRRDGWLGWRRLGLAAVVLVLVVGAAGPSAATAPSWSLQSTPNPGGSTNALLAGVSCASTTSCIAVGTNVGSGGGDTLAEAWNGSSWVAQTTPNPTGATYAALGGVSCVAPTECTAVGTYYTSTGQSSLAEARNGAKWKIQRTPNPSGATETELYSVSCLATGAGTPAPEFCAAVGAYTNASGTQLPFAETWNGTKWVRSRVAARSGATFNVLAGVSCISATECTAVGNDTNTSSIQVTLVEMWNGSKWQIKASPNPPVDPNAVLTSVSCTSATACTAGGYAQKKLNPALYDAVAESWNGKKWTISSPPATSGETVFHGVACVPANACIAVGIGSNGGDGFTLAEISNGTGWSTQTTPNPAGGGGFVEAELSAISCPSAAMCMAVGRNMVGTTVSTLAELYS